MVVKRSSSQYVVMLVGMLLVSIGWGLKEPKTIGVGLRSETLSWTAEASSPLQAVLRRGADQARSPRRSPRAIPSLGERTRERSANQNPEAFWRLKETEGFSFASGAHVAWGPVRIQAHAATARVVRIGLNPTRFSATGDVLVEFDTATEQRHERITLTATGPFTLLERAPHRASERDTHLTQGSGSCDGVPIAYGRVGEEFTFMAVPEGILITAESFAGVIAASLCVEPAPGALLVVTSLRRRNLNRAGNPFEPPRYRGVLEIHRSPSVSGEDVPAPFPGGPEASSQGEGPRLRLINVLDLEAYLQGVITNEMPASFHPEALRAQAVAARTFALAHLGRFAERGFDLDDSTQSQVYRGVLSEHPNGTAAVQSTSGLVVVREGLFVPTFYSSSMGGHTESNEWIFNSPSDQLPGENAHPALRAVHDGDFPVPVDLASDEGALLFYSQAWDHFDSPGRSGNTRYRWMMTRSAAFIAGRLLSLYGVSLGPITALVPLLRSPSGRIARLQIVGERGAFVLQGWRALRDFFQLLNSPSAILTRREADGTLSFDLYGGGWGHNVGLSQYGAHGRGRSGQTFRDILAAYYTGAEVIAIEEVGSHR